MTITNKKLLKNFKNILSSSLSAKEIIKSEIDKVDEKYRKLAEAEKHGLNEQMAVLDEQIKLYSTFLKDEEIPVVDNAPAEEEEKVVDTLYEDNNDEEEGTSEKVEETVDESQPVDELPEGALDDPNRIIDEWPEDAVESEEETEEKSEDNDDEWPTEPQEW